MQKVAPVWAACYSHFNQVQRFRRLFTIGTFRKLPCAHIAASLAGADECVMWAALRQAGFWDQICIPCFRPDFQARSSRPFFKRGRFTVGSNIGLHLVENRPESTVKLNAKESPHGVVCKRLSPLRQPSSAQSRRRAQGIMACSTRPKRRVRRAE